MAFLAFVLLGASDALAQVRAGSVTSLTGDVHVERAGTTVPATPGMALNVGDRIVTAGNSRVTMTLTDNSKLELDESTSLVIDQQLVTANSRTRSSACSRAWCALSFRTRRRRRRTSSSYSQRCRFGAWYPIRHRHWDTAAQHGQRGNP